MDLCEFCQGTGRTSCEAQKQWNDSEIQLNIYMRLITEDWDEIGPDPALKSSLDETLEELIKQRAEGAAKFKRDADQLGCNNLVILAFAK
ncbi:MAG: hypothetical protein AAB557_03770 [Patescibacteria group bacterium]